MVADVTCLTGPSRWGAATGAASPFQEGWAGTGGWSTQWGRRAHDGARSACLWAGLPEPGPNRHPRGLCGL